MKEGEKLATAAQVAEYLSVSEHTVYRWCRNGKMPHYNLNTSYRFNLHEIAAWLESRHSNTRPRKIDDEEVA